jgi:glucoamylase
MTNEDQVKIAPGWPGIPPRWSSSAKTGVGASLSHASQVWFTLSHGIVDEIYYPRVDQACTRDLGLVVTNGTDFFSEEKRHTTSKVSYIASGVPAYRLTNTCIQGRYQIIKEIIADPRHDTLLQRIKFLPAQGSLQDYHLYVLLAPHIGNHGYGNNAWVGDYKGDLMLFAERDGNALALNSSTYWINRSAGFVGVSDGWQDLSQNYQMTWAYSKAENGNVALTGEVDLIASGGEFILALGFGRNGPEAGFRARASLMDGFDQVLRQYIQEWQAWQETLLPLEPTRETSHNVYQVSTGVLRIHEAKRFPGGLIASLSIPWGFIKGDDDIGGYHLVWPRDLVEAAGGLLAAGAKADGHRILHYLGITQEADGHWPQNMWLDGAPYWDGIQLDETAFPILLVDLSFREHILSASELPHYWSMVCRAASFIVRNGPVTQEDRWEEDPGYSPFTLAVEIAALLTAAGLAEQNGELAIAGYLRETADTWNASIERWTYVQDTDLARQVGVDGYYVRIAPPEEAEAASPADGFVPIKNRPQGQSQEPASQIISPDALSLVRFGLRAADDPRILNTIRVIDRLLKVETPSGPAWHRYNDDGYGEHEDGSPFDGVGVGRAWPLLTGERAHYELAAKHFDEANRLMEVLRTFSNEGGLIPEQVWDSPDIPEKELFFGRPSGSAMPLVWAHAEYVKLCRSLRDGRVFDTPPEAAKRYAGAQPDSPFTTWRFNGKIRSMPTGKLLRVELLSPAIIYWTNNQWKTSQDIETRDSGLGIFLVDLPTSELSTGTQLGFTFHWRDPNRWEGLDYYVQVV